MSMYHWEADQEDFLVLAGDALLIVEGEERPLREWDFVHCPAGTKHVLVRSGDASCIVLAVGARDHSTGPDWGGYSVDEAALRHGASIEQETTDQFEAYARFTKREHESVGSDHVARHIIDGLAAHSPPARRTDCDRARRLDPKRGRNAGNGIDGRAELQGLLPLALDRNERGDDAALAGPGGIACVERW